MGPVLIHTPFFLALLHQRIALIAQYGSSFFIFLEIGKLRSVDGETRERQPTGRFK